MALPLRRLVPVAAAAVLPWSWFAVRDARPLLDLVATGLPVAVGALAVPVLLAAAATRRVALAVLGLSLSAMGAWAVVGPWLPAPGEAPVRPLRVVAANALSRNPHIVHGAADVGAQNGDVVVVVENAVGVYEELNEDFEYPMYGPEAEHAVLSRFPVRLLPHPGGLSRPMSVTRWEVSAPGGPVVLYAVHLGRPRGRQADAVRWALRRQRSDVEAIMRAVREEELPVMVVGDLNVSDRAWGYRRITSVLSDAMRAERAGPTYLRPRYRPFLLRIDHLFVSPGWCSGASERFTIAGSDHLGVAADVGPCP